MSTSSAVSILEQNFQFALSSYEEKQQLQSLQGGIAMARSLCNFGETDKSAEAFLALANATQKNPSDKVIVMDAILSFAAEQKNDLSMAAQLCLIPLHLQQTAPTYLSPLSADYAIKSVGLIHSYLASADAAQSTDFYGIAQLYGAWGFSRTPQDPVAAFMTNALQRAQSQTPPHYDGIATLIQASITANQLNGRPTAQLGYMAFQFATEAVKDDASGLAVGLLLELAHDHLPHYQADAEKAWIEELQAWRISGDSTCPLPQLPPDISAALEQHKDPIMHAELQQMSVAISTFEATRAAKDFRGSLQQIKYVHSMGCTEDSTNALGYLLDTLEDFSPLMPQLLQTIKERLEDDFMRDPLPLSNMATLYNALCQKEVPTDTFYETLAATMPLVQEAVAVGLWFKTQDHKGLTALLPVCEQGLEKQEAAAILETASTTLNFMKMARPDVPPLLMGLANLAAEYQQPTRPFVQIALGQLKLERAAEAPDQTHINALAEVVCFHTPKNSMDWLQATKAKQPAGPRLAPRLDGPSV